VALALLLGLVAAAPAGAIARPQAERLALKVLNPGRTIEVNLSHVSPPGNQKVTVPAMAVSWK
jgi:hypothetical protein